MADITYGMLKNQVLTNIKALVKNIDTLNVPSSLQSGYSIQMLGDTNSGFNIDTDDGADYPTVVTTAQLTQDLNDYCSSHGINGNDSDIVTTNGLLNFYNVIGNFVAARIVMYTPFFRNSAEVIPIYKRTDVNIYGNIVPAT